MSPSLWALAWYAVAGVATFAVYALDKSRSRRAARRTPESTLHTLELIGGCLGALAARRLLRHKTRKPRFLAISWLILLAHAVAWAAAWWMSRH
jgi:uncharacterized membrane protein YsdA (DUF1294 family)